MNNLLIERIKNIDILIGKNIISHEKKPDKIKNFNQARILNYLFENISHPVYQKDIGDALKLKKSSITEHLDYLEKEGFIIRKEGKDDKRKKEIVCCEKTINQINRLQVHLEKVNEKAISSLSKKELLDFEKILSKIERNLMI